MDAVEDCNLRDHPAAIPERLPHHPRAVFMPNLASAAQVVRRAIETGAADNLLAALAREAVADRATAAN